MDITGSEIILFTGSNACLSPGPPPPTSRGYPWGHDGTFEFTSAVSIVPDTFPAEECQDLDCLGSLV